MCHPMWAHWRHLANTIELVLPSAHPSPQPKRQVDRFSRFWAAHGSVVGYTGATWQIRLNLCFIWPTRVHNINGKSISAAVSAQLRAESHLHWETLAPKISPSHAASGPHLIHDSLAILSPQSKRHHDRFSYFLSGDRRVSLYFTMGASFPKNCPFLWGIWTPSQP